MTDEPSSASSARPGRGMTLIAAGLLLIALSLVVLYTERRAFLSPLALVVVAAIGVAALLLQVRLRPGLSHPDAGPAEQSEHARAPLWLNIAGVTFAMLALFADVLRLGAGLLLVAALASVVSFAVAGIFIISALRKRQS